MFAKFAYTGDADDNFDATTRLVAQQQSNKRTHDLKRERPEVTKKLKKADKCDFTPVRLLPAAEQERVVHKWLSFADHVLDVEDARFVVLVAARLHARCQDVVVRQAMAQLSTLLEGNVTVARVAMADPKNLETATSCLQYYSTKCQHIVQAAREIRSSSAGLVPENEAALRHLTGIGPVMADVLGFVNTRQRHLDRRQERNASSSNNV